MVVLEFYHPLYNRYWKKFTKEQREGNKWRQPTGGLSTCAASTKQDGTQILGYKYGNSTYKAGISQKPVDQK